MLHWNSLNQLFNNKEHALLPNIESIKLYVIAQTLMLWVRFKQMKNTSAVQGSAEKQLILSEMQISSKLLVI